MVPIFRSNREPESMSEMANCVGVTLGRAHFARVSDDNTTLLVDIVDNKDSQAFTEPILLLQC